MEEEQILIHDSNYLRYLLEEERDAVLISYIEQNFPIESWEYQRRLMLHFPYFSNKILDDFELSNEEKQAELLNSLGYGKSKIITIIGGRGQGKTALAMYLIEQSYIQGFQKNIYYVKKGERPKWLPDWIKSAQIMEDVPNGCLAMLDETAIEYGARSFYRDENKSFTERLVILRHKDISLILVTQHSKLVDINIRRLSDILIYKRGADLDLSESDKDEKKKIRARLLPRVKEEALIEIRNDGKFYLIRNPLPEWWNDYEVSKTFRDFSPEEMRRKSRQHRLKGELDIYRQKEQIRAEEMAKKNIKQKKSSKNKGDVEDKL